MKHIIFELDGKRTRINSRIFGELAPLMHLEKIGFLVDADIPLSSDDAMDLYLNYVDDFMIIQLLLDDYDIEILNTCGLTRYNIPYIMNKELLEAITEYMAPHYFYELKTELGDCDAHQFYYEYVTRYADDKFLDTMLLKFGLTI